MQRAEMKRTGIQKFQGKGIAKATSAELSELNLKNKLEETGK